MNKLFLLPLLLILFTSTMIFHDFVFADNWVLPLSPWSCPSNDPSVPASTIDKDNDGKADRMYIHIIDENGNDVQEWCLDHGSTGDYAYYISSPGRNDTYVGGCLLYCGINNPTINTTGNVTITTLNGTEIIDPNNGSFSGTLNGTIIGHVNGTIKFFNHTNHVPIGHFGRDAGKDFHFYYNFTTGGPPLKMWTKILANGTHQITRTIQLAMIPHETPDGHILAQDFAFLERGLPGFVGSNIIGERGITPDEHILHSQDILVGDSTHKVLFSSTSPIDDISLESKNTLKITLQKIEEPKQVNLSIPRNLIDHTLEESFKVLTDGEIKTSFNEDTSLSHRTLTITAKPGISYLLIDAPISSTVSQKPVSNTNFVVGYQISNGDIIQIVPDPENSSLMIKLNSSEKGELTLSLLRDLIDSKTNDVDGELLILIDGELTNNFKESKTSTDRTLTISFPTGTEQIEIRGTYVIPEFGTIAMMILVVAIMSIIAVTAKSRVIPKF